MTLWLLLVFAAPLVAYQLWHAVGLIASLVACRRQALPADPGDATARVAILYATCDDFRASACRTLLDQHGVRFDLYILDDSTDAELQAAVDAWARQQSRTVHVVRRSDRRGHKAGNLNHWLATCGDPARYRYALLVDADEHVPPDFLSRLLARAEATGAAFVQACHLGTTLIETPFQRLLHPQVDCQWRYFMAGRNLIGIPPMLGHGVLLALEPVRAVGGFPDLVSEDLGLTLRLARRGHTGIIAPDILGHEEFPRSYRAYWTRWQRWIAADAELVRVALSSLLSAPQSVWRRLDLAAREVRLPLAAAYWCLLVTLAVCGTIDVSPEVVLPPSAWSLLSLTLGPALPVIASRHLRPSSRLRYIASMSFVGAATCALNPVAAVSGWRGRHQFRPTGARDTTAPTPSSRLALWELATGGLVLWGGAVGHNAALAAVGLAILLSPLMRTRHERPVLAVGVLLFWGLILLQVAVDVTHGGVPVTHLMALCGLTVTLV